MLPIPFRIQLSTVTQDVYVQIHTCRKKSAAPADRKTKMGPLKHDSRRDRKGSQQMRRNYTRVWDQLHAVCND